MITTDRTAQAIPRLVMHVVTVISAGSGTCVSHPSRDDMTHAADIS